MRHMLEYLGQPGCPFFVIRESRTPCNVQPGMSLTWLETPGFFHGEAYFSETREKCDP